MQRPIAADVIQQENAGTEQRFIATLSTWLKPNRPVAGLSLESAIAKRRSERARIERQKAEREAEARRQQEEERINRLEAEWRDSDPVARELWAKAWDFSGGFDHLSDAMGDYRAYRDEKLKPG